MELMTPQILWKDFDTASPFDETVLRFASCEGARIKEFYFSGLRTADGVIRIFAKYLHNGDGLPTLIVFGDHGDALTIPKVKSYNVLVADYTGVREGKGRGTMYPASLKDALRFRVVQGISPKESKWYAWASVAISTALYAKKNFGGKIAMLGIGTGGSLVWKLSAVTAVDAGITLFSSDYLPDNDDLHYMAALDNRAYAPILRFPMLEIVSSNEADGSLEFMSEIFAAIKGKDSRFCINERTDHVLGEDGKRNIQLWLSHHLNKEDALPDTPTLRPYQSGGKLYYEVAYNGSPDEIALYTSEGDVDGSVRNWSGASLMRVGESYLAEVGVSLTDQPICAFVTVKEHGYKVSSTVAVRKPSELGVVAQPVKSNRLVYDSDMGTDDWIMLSGDKPIMKQGPFGIEGVSAVKPLVTFKLADVRYKGLDEAVLQIMFCAKEKAQRVKFVITDAKKRRYVCQKEVDSRQGWITQSFAADDFKLQNESLSWEDVVAFEVEPDGGEVLVSSMLWV